MMNDSKRRLMPKLRFPEFRDKPGWEEKQLKGLAALINERVGTAKCTPYTVTSGVGLVSQQEKFGRSIAGNSFKNYLRLKKNDFAYNKSATKAFPQGYIARYFGNDAAAVPNSIFTCFRVDDSQVDPAYLDYLFAGNLHGKWLKRFLTIGARAHGSLNVDDDDLLSLPIPLPGGRSSNAEQKKIADCLSSLDDLIATEGRKLEALRAYKKGLMQQFFPRPGETRPRLRFPQFRDRPEWLSKTLGDAATFYNGRAYAKEELLDNGKYKVLRVGNFFTNDHWYYSDLELDNTKYCDKGDLLYAWSASFGPRIWHGNKTIYHYHIWKVVEKSGIDKSFLFFRLEWDSEQMRARSANGIGMFHITKGTIEGWGSSFPQPDEQKCIAACLTYLDTQIAAQTDRLESLRRHKRGLMQQLFPSPEEPEA